MNKNVNEPTTETHDLHKIPLIDYKLTLPEYNIKNTRLVLL